jgi:predicted ATPase/class 3 adenylate cyclase
VTALPTGTVTLLFTDVEGSTRLWEQQPEDMRAALSRHDALIEDQVNRHGGVLVRPRGEGDSRFVVFSRAVDALSAAAAMQQALHEEAWAVAGGLRVRMALHTGDADLRDGDYYGSAVNRCARLRAIAHGGQTLVSQATYDLVRDALPAGVGLRDLGEHRLADLQRPEQVFQMVAAGLPAEFPPLRSLESVPHNLPVQLTSFVGREREIAEITRALATARLMTLTGTGGAGKTRLALQVAAGLVEAYPDGVWFVDLAPLADPALVPNTTAAVMGVHDSSERPATEALVGALRARRVLLVLDNCEHLLAACAQFADALVRGCPHLRVLATSRAPLGLIGETVHRVPSLAVPAQGQPEPLERLTQYEAVRLFVERAMAARSDFQVTNATAPALAEICWRLDGIPLAIELAAARVRVLGLEQIARRLDNRFRLLTGGSRTALPRQQTLRALVDWSHDLLGDVEKILLRRLSVFAGGWTLEATEAVCAGEDIAADEVLDLLGGLVDKSLVVAEELASRDVAAGEVRYRLLETIRQYAAEKLQACGEGAAVRARHAAYYLELAETAWPHLARQEQLAWYARLEADLDNLRASLRWTMEQGAALEGLRLCGALFTLWALRGRATEGRAWFAGLLAVPAGQAATSARALALGYAGLLAHQQGDTAGGQRLMEEALALGRQLDDRGAMAWALLWLVYPTEPRDPRERPNLEESLALYRALGDEWGIAEALHHLASLLAVQGEIALARTYLDEAEVVARRTGDRRHLGIVRQHLGGLSLAAGNLADAHRLAEEALALFRELGDLPDVVIQENDLGDLALRQGKYARARAWYAASLTHQQGWQPVPWTLASLCGLAAVALAQGDVEHALCLAAATAAISAQAGYPLGAAVEQTIAAAHATLDEREAAAAWAEGEAMTRERAIAYALEGPLQATGSAAPRRA